MLNDAHFCIDERAIVLVLVLFQWMTVMLYCSRKLSLNKW